MENHHGDLSSRSEGMDSSHERSYDCFFCKRGFSTAQALGGHMNIHRKDRAKQKQQLATNHGSSTALYFNLPNISFSSGSLKIKGRQYSTSVSGSGGESETSSIMRWPRSYYRGDDAHLEEIDGLKRPLWQQLPFLVDRPSADVDHGGECPLRSITSELLISAEEELDLELRLGPSIPCGGATGEKRKMEVKEVRRP